MNQGQLQKMSYKDTQQFRFGKNWKNFLSYLDDERVQRAEDSLKESLLVSDLKGLRFLDVGCGSGLISLAAHRLGAELRSFDVYQDSVACALQIKKIFFF